MELAATNIYLQQIMVFLAMVEQKNFTKVGESLHLTQSAVSKRIATLEKELGFPLFSRTTREVVVTPMGLALYKQWKPAMEMIESGNTAALAVLHQEENTLQVGIADTVDQNAYFWPTVEAFEARHPNFTWNVESASFDVLKTNLIEGIYDIAFMPDFQGDSLSRLGIPWILAASSAMEAFVPFSSPLFHKEELTLKELAQEKFITLADKDYSTWLLSVFEGQPVQPQFQKVLKGATQIANVYRPSDGLLFLADHYIRFRETDRVRRIPVPEYKNGILCCWRPDLQKKAALSFVHFVNETV